MRFGPHTIADFVVAYKAPPRRPADGGTIHPRYVDIHQTAQRMGIFNLATKGFHHPRREVYGQIGLIARFQVLHLHVAEHAAKTVQKRLQTCSADKERVSVSLDGTGKLHREADQ